MDTLRHSRIVRHITHVSPSITKHLSTWMNRLIRQSIFRRITLGSLKKLQADDWAMIVVLVPFTASIVLANQITDFQSVRERKFRYVLEEMQLITVWLVKACLLALYWRILYVLFPLSNSSSLTLS